MFVLCSWTARYGEGVEVRDVVEGRGWIILRTSGGRTLQLAASLAQAGFDVWTPAETITRLVRHGRSKVKRDIVGAILPTFVFARADRYPDLAGLASRQITAHPPFSIFRHGGHTPFIGDAAMAGVREIEGAREAERLAAIEAERVIEVQAAERAHRAEKLRTEAARRKSRRSVRRDFAMGAAVTVSGMPALAGLSGQVVRSNGASALVFFGGSLTMEIEAWQLAARDVDGDTTSAV
jgi:hypothetical protein